MPQYYDDWFDGDLQDLHYLSRPETVLGIDLIPFEFVKTTPFSTNRERNEFELSKELAKISIPNPESTIVLAHDPPYGHRDKVYSGQHVGSIYVYEWIKEYQPLAWICGHIHEDYGVLQIGETMVINCANLERSDRLRGFFFDTETRVAEAMEV